MAAPHCSSPLKAAKRAARAEALDRRAGCNPALGARLAEYILRDRPPPPGAVVAGFWPMHGEIDIRPLLIALVERGHRVVLPVTPGRGEILTFRRWQSGARLVAGRFGTQHPDGEEMRPDFLLVPLLAFDRAGRRLGYGGGFYDRTLAALAGATAIGCAFAAQEIDAVPAGPGDAWLDGVATERGIIDCRSR